MAVRLGLNAGNIVLISNYFTEDIVGCVGKSYHDANIKPKTSFSLQCSAPLQCNLICFQRKL